MPAIMIDPIQEEWNSFRISSWLSFFKGMSKLGLTKFFFHEDLKSFYCVTIITSLIRFSSILVRGLVAAGIKNVVFALVYVSNAILALKVTNVEKWMIKARAHFLGHNMFPCHCIHETKCSRCWMESRTLF